MGRCLYFQKNKNLLILFFIYLVPPKNNARSKNDIYDVVDEYSDDGHWGVWEKIYDKE